MMIELIAVVSYGLQVYDQMNWVYKLLRMELVRLGLDKSDTDAREVLTIEIDLIRWGFDSN